MITRNEAVRATLLLSLVVVIVAAPVISGRGAVWPESILDRDPFYATGAPPPRPVTSDLSPLEQHYPRDLAFARGLHAGRIDLWNPLAAAGAPLWAEQGGPFFPLKIPFYVAPSPATYQVYLLLRLLLAAAGAYVLARRRGLGDGPALAAAVGFEISAALIAPLPYGAASPLYVLPWVLLGALAIARAPRGRTVAGAAVALALAASGGHPTLILMVFGAFAAAIAGHAVAAASTPRAALAIAVAAAAAVVLGLVLAAPSLLPFAELAMAGDSYKSRLSGTLMYRWQLLESRMTAPIALFAPGTFRAVHPRLQTIFDLSAAVGMLALVLGVAGILQGGLDLALIAVALLGVALTCAPPGLGWLHALPGVGLILPTYGWPLVTIALTQAAGRAVAGLTERGSWRAIAGAAVVVLLGSTTLLLLDDPKLSKPFATILHSALHGPFGPLRLLLPPLFAAAVLAIAFALWRGGRQRAGALVVAAAIALELLVEVVPLVWTAPARLFRSTTPPAVRFLGQRLADGQSRMMGYPYTVARPLTTMLFDLRDLRGSSPLPVGRYVDYLRAIDPKAAQFVTQDVSVLRSPLLDRAAVRYVVLGQPDLSPEWIEPETLLLEAPERPTDDPTMPVVYSDEYVVVYENRQALPRTRVVHDVATAADPAAALQRLAAWTDGTANARQSVVIEGPSDLAQTRRGADSGDTVRITDASDPDRLLLEASLASDGLVVVADTYYPGWRAFVDGAPVAILPADGMFRAVRVPAGKHAVELRYRPISFRIGVGLLVLGLVITAILCRAAGSPLRHQPPPPGP
jgi:hypothetical protein